MEEKRFWSLWYLFPIDFQGFSYNFHSNEWIFILRKSWKSLTRLRRFIGALKWPENSLLVTFFFSHLLQWNKQPIFAYLPNFHPPSRPSHFKASLKNKSNILNFDIFLLSLLLLKLDSCREISNRDNLNIVSILKRLQRFSALSSKWGGWEENCEGEKMVNNIQEDDENARVLKTRGKERKEAMKFQIFPLSISGLEFLSGMSEMNGKSTLFL